jgi:dephospho-CoA kinase
MKYVGLTGGMGSGKTVVAQLFQIMGVPVFDSDAFAKRLYDTDISLREALINLFGSSIYQGAVLNKEQLADLIFNQPASLKKVNELIHPRVGVQWENWVRNQKEVPLVVQETAILFEAGLVDRFDAVITVSASESVRVKRVCRRSNLSENQVLKRMKNQLPEIDKINKSDYIIVNDNDEPLIPQVLTVLHELSL